MAALIEGQQYGLSAQGKINSNKTIIFVKLTDSALSSIEKYVKNKGSADSKPTIQFQNSNGVLSLPQNGFNQMYGFSLSNIDTEGPQGSFECLQQMGQRSLESLGCMHMKMHIHANEDSYENTRVKMAAVEKEKNKSCTKEIKVAGTNFARKVKVKRPGFVGPPKPLNSPPIASLISKNPLKITNGISNGISNNIPSKKLLEVNKYQKPVPVKNKPSASPELLRQPIRDRIIHILALRPYRRPELMCRLNSEGVKEKDKKGITAILTQVGVLKKNEYNLANYCWNEVQDNWKFATQEELEIIRRRKQQRLSANAANESPPINTSSSNSSSPVQKRVAADSFPVGSQEPRGKKQRISHYNRTGNSNPSVKYESSDSSDKLHLTTTSVTRKSAYSPSMNGIDAEGESSPSKSPNNSCDGFPKKPRLTHSRTDNFNHNNKKDTSDSSEKLPFTSISTRKVTATHPVESNNGVAMDIESSPKSPDYSCDGFSNLSLKNSVSNHSDDALSSSSLRNASREVAEKSIRKHTNGLSPQENRNYERSFHKVQQPAKRHELDDSNVRHSSSYSKSSVNNDTNKSSFQNQTLSHTRLTDSFCDPKPQVSPDSNTQYQAKDVKVDSCSKNVVNGYVNNSIKSNGYSNQSSYVNRSKVTSTTNGSCSTSPHSPESYSDSNDSMGNSPGITHHNLPPTPDSYSELPDYVVKYVRIKSPEQRSKYKQDFNAQYDEYLLLHSKIEKIKSKFKHLYHSLCNFDKGSEEYQKISLRIEKAYKACQGDENYKKSEEKLDYLHKKLSHIKKLVMEYDNEYFARS